MKTKIITTYSITELTGTAQERAFDWLREGLFADSFWYEAVIDDAVRIGALFGLDLESQHWTSSNGFKGKSPSVYWDILRVSVERYDDKELTEGAEDAVTEALNDFGYWILNRLEGESEWLSSEETLLDMAAYDDYQFDEDGRAV